MSSSTWVIVVAAGRSERFGGATPKLLVPHRGRPLLADALAAVDACPAVDGIVLVASEALRRAWEEMGRPGRKIRAVVEGGLTRQASVAAGLAALPAEAGVVLVHDGARAFASPGLFAAVAQAAAEAGCALPLLAVHDTVKRVREGRVVATIPREELRLAQTPQGFRRDVLERAHEAAARGGWEATDDVALVERLVDEGLMPAVEIREIPGEETNVKVTRPSDLPFPAPPRVGLGHDVHPLAAGRKLVLAGVDLQAGTPDAERWGPVGHSDGDVLVHAACDALLGATALGDIGSWFPDTDPAHAGRPSLPFLQAIVQRLHADGWRVASLSAVLKLERPRVAPHAEAIRRNLAGVLGLQPEAVGLSAKRGEGLGPVGEGRAIECDCVAVVERA